MNGLLTGEEPGVDFDIHISCEAAGYHYTLWRRKMGRRESPSQLMAGHAPTRDGLVTIVAAVLRGHLPESAFDHQGDGRQFTHGNEMERTIRRIMADEGYGIGSWRDDFES